MPHIHYRTVKKDALGTTSGTLETVGDITTSADATDVIAFCAVAANTATRTASEATTGEFIVNARSLANETFNFMKSAADGGAPATNIAEFVENVKFFPFLPLKTSMGNRKITFQYDAATPEPTAEMAAQCSVVFAEGGYPADVLQNNGRLMTRHAWSDSATCELTASTTSEAFDTEITVPAWVKEITAISITAVPDAAGTAGEHFIGTVDITGTISGLYPMQVPCPGVHASLGTPVGSGTICHENILPMYIQCPNADATLTLTMNLLTAMTGIYQIEVTLYGR